MRKNLALIVSFLSLTGALFGQIDRSKVPAPQSNPEIKIEIPGSMSFRNGLQVIMVENHKLPKVSFQLFVNYPAPMEGDKVGLRDIFGQMLECGTKNTPKDEFDEKIDYIGATFFPNSRGFYASSLKKHTPELLTLLNEVLTQPAFAKEDFDRIISQNLSNLAALPSNASSMSNNVSSVVNYGKNHPYGEITTEETLGNITLTDVKDFYKENFIPNHAYLVVVGDINRDDVKSYVSAYFENWQKGENLTKNDYVVPRAKGNNVFFVHKPGAVQSVISITHNVKLTPGHEDEIKLRVLNHILGGGSFSARLMSNLREDKAYTYGCYSSISGDPLIGSFSAGGSFRNEVTDSAIVQILAEIKRITESPVTDKELDLAKKSMTGAFARSLESPQTVARFALNTVRYNLPADYYSTYLMRLERITKEDLLMVADAYLNPEDLNIVVVGNEEIAEKLEVLDSDGKIDYKNYYGAHQEMLKSVPDGVTAQTVIDQYIMNLMMVNSKDELAQKLTEIQQIETLSEADFPQANGKLIAYRAQAANNQTASLMHINSPVMSGELQKEWFDGNNGGTSAQGILNTYEGEELAEKKKPNFPCGQINYSKDNSINTELLGIEEVDGVEYYKVKVTESESVSFEHYDVKSGMLMKTESYEEGQDGEQVAVIVSFANYTAENGMMLPKNTTINSQGQVIAFEVVSCKISKKIKSKAFAGDFKKAEKMISKL